MAATPEEPEYASIRECVTPRFNLYAILEEQIAEQNLNSVSIALKPLAKFEGNEKGGIQQEILFSLVDYLQWVGYTGRIIRPDKHSAPTSDKKACRQD